MKIVHLFWSIVFLLMSSISFAQTTIEMEEAGGVYRIPCKINGLKLKFIFDTGASDVCISSTVANMMLDNGYLDKSDIVGTGASQIANGEIVEHTKIIIREIEIAGLVLENVEASVMHQQEAPLLMGQSAIQKLGPIEINGSQLIIRNANKITDSNQLEKLLDQVYAALEMHDYEKAEEKLAQLYQTGAITDYYKYLYAEMCWRNNKLEKADRILSEISDYQYFILSKEDIYELIGHIKCDLEKYDVAIQYYKLSYDKILTSYDDRAKNRQWIANCYEYKGDFKNAGEYYTLAIYELSRKYGVTQSYLQQDAFNELKRGQQSYRDDNLDYLFFKIFYCGVHAGMLSNSEGWLILEDLAEANNRHARKYLNQNR